LTMAAPNADFQNIGTAFADHYYNTFDGPTADQLQHLYQDDSLCTYDSEQFMGMKGIMTKLMGLKQSVPGMKHNLTTKDCQPITAGNGILVAVTGDIAVNGQVFKFAQAFVLMPTAAGSWYMANSIFRSAANTTANPPNPADKSDVGKAFCDHYFQTFDTQRANLQTLYQDTSLLSFENEQFMGMQSIMTKLTTLQFTTVQHAVATCDCHPQAASSGILILIAGDLAADGETTKPLKFSQAFVLLPTPAGSWYIAHDIFRLNIG